MRQGLGGVHAVARDSQASREKTGMCSLAFLLHGAGDICHTVYVRGETSRARLTNAVQARMDPSNSPADPGLCLWAPLLLFLKVNPNSLFYRTPNS